MGLIATIINWIKKRLTMSDQGDPPIPPTREEMQRHNEVTELKRRLREEAEEAAKVPGPEA